MRLKKPRFTHDCEHCKYLGHWSFLGTYFDLYFCKRGNDPTVIARYGSEGHEYTSGLNLTGGPQSLLEAKYRAKQFGYLKEAK